MIYYAIAGGALLAFVLAQYSGSRAAQGRVGVDVQIGSAGVYGVDAVLLIAEKAGLEYGVPPGMMSRLVLRESSGDPAALGDGGQARGLCQIQVATWGELVRLGLVKASADPWDPVDTCRAGAAYLAHLRGRFGDWRSAAAAYNWGPAHVAAKEPWPASVSGYVADVVGVV